MELPKLLFCKAAALPEAMFGRLFPKHRTLLQTADIDRPAECAATNFIDRGKRSERGRPIPIPAGEPCAEYRG